MCFWLPRCAMGMVLTALFAFTSVSRADLYEITFTDPGADNVGSGQIDVEGGYAVSGSFDVTVGAATGAWNLYSAGGTGGTWNSLLTSPQGAFIYDNVVYLDPNINPQYPGSSFLDKGGLLLTDGNNDELNLWGDGNGVYSLYAEISGVKYNPAVDSGFSTITAVPEPINYALAGFGLIFVGGSARRFYIGRRRAAASSWSKSFAKTLFHLVYFVRFRKQLFFFRH
jgi:hypothetical protein